jgi:hypothetical protein
MARPLVRLADIPQGTRLTLFTRNLDKSYRRSFRWKGKPIKGSLVVGPKWNGAVVMFDEHRNEIPFSEDTLWRV